MPVLDNDEPCTDPAFQRTVLRGAWAIGASTIVYIILLFAVPRSLKSLIGLGGMAVICIGALGLAFWAMSHHPATNQWRPAGRRYTRRFLPAMMLYVLVFEAATWYYMHRHPTGLAAVLAGLAPSVPVLFAIRAMLLLLKEETDEYLRTRALETWSIATGLALCVCTVWGFLDQFEVVAHLPLWAAFPLWAVCIGPAQIIVNKRHA